MPQSYKPLNWLKFGTTIVSDQRYEVGLLSCKSHGNESSTEYRSIYNSGRTRPMEVALSIGISRKRRLKRNLVAFDTLVESSSSWAGRQPLLNKGLPRSSSRRRTPRHPRRLTYWEVCPRYVFRAAVAVTTTIFLAQWPSVLRETGHCHFSLQIFFCEFPYFEFCRAKIFRA